jgi:hypothetical protein
MISKDFEDIVCKQFKYCYKLLFEKAKQYNIGTEDRLHAFKVASAFEGISTKQALFGMLSKHLVSLSDMIRKDSVQPLDVWNEKISDSINYLLLLKAIIEEEAES